MSQKLSYCSMLFIHLVLECIGAACCTHWTSVQPLLRRLGCLEVSWNNSSSIAQGFSNLMYLQIVCRACKNSDCWSIFCYSESQALRWSSQFALSLSFQATSMVFLQWVALQPLDSAHWAGKELWVVSWETEPPEWKAPHSIMWGNESGRLECTRGGAKPVNKTLPSQ